MFGKDAIVISLKLFIITALAALCLAFVNKVTNPIIQVNTAKAEEEALQKVLATADSFKKIENVTAELDGVKIEKVTVGFDKSKNPVGYVVTAVSNEGYGGDIKVMVGIDKELKVTKIEILEHSETAGLGANAKKPKFAGQFEGKGTDVGALSVIKGEAKNENEISAISSATITSKAVTKVVNAALATVEQVADKGTEKNNQPEDAKGGNE